LGARGEGANPSILGGVPKKGGRSIRPQRRTKCVPSPKEFLDSRDLFVTGAPAFFEPATGVQSQRRMGIGIKNAAKK
jgi:hypothetical protein